MDEDDAMVEVLLVSFVSGSGIKRESRVFHEVSFVIKAHWRENRAYYRTPHKLNISTRSRWDSASNKKGDVFQP